MSRHVHMPRSTAQGTLNAFLVNNTLYECLAGDCNNLVLNAEEAITPWYGRWHASPAATRAGSR